MDPRNFMRNLYANDGYQKLKANTEQCIVENAKTEVENKHFISEMDTLMADLKSWKNTRQPAVSSTDSDEEHF